MAADSGRRGVANAHTSTRIGGEGSVSLTTLWPLPLRRARRATRMKTLKAAKSTLRHPTK